MHARLCVFLQIAISLFGCDAKDPGSLPTARDIHETQLRGDSVVSHLVNYKKSTGHYPSELSDLVPKYAKTLQPPLFGKWAYKALENNTEFVLKFGGDAAPSSGCPEYWTSSKELKQWYGF